MRGRVRLHPVVVPFHLKIRVSQVLGKHASRQWPDQRVPELPTIKLKTRLSEAHLPRHVAQAPRYLLVVLKHL